MSSVLFDVPGPRARTRQRIGTVLVAALLVGIGYVVVRRLTEEQFTVENLDELFQPGNFEAIGEGLLGTVQAAAIAIVTSVLFGLVFAAMRLADNRLVGAVAWTVVEFFRAVPLLMLILIIFYSPVKDVMEDVGVPGDLGSLVLGLTLYNGAVLAEVFRAGVNAVPTGQAEAAYAVGMRKGQVLRLIQVPQAVRIMLPAIISQCVVILKDTSLGYVIIYDELLSQANNIGDFIGANLLTYVCIALIYVSINYSLSRVATWLEARTTRAARSSAQRVEGATGALTGG
ncbi:MAG: amino acid ABC transporter permease [Nocardioidaceae bacterium]|nr:amino acid ABC transporter permease [Nocardioidaceae bacterium]